VGRARDLKNVDVHDLSQPLAHYWNACSHNSYIVGDQLTGLSTADAYRRQLIQQCRHVEIDCWDGRNGSPNVTHGNTFVNNESFDAVAKAVAECAFITSELPVVLSLEMHCSPPQQRQLALMMVKHIGEALYRYEDIEATGRALLLSLSELKHRVLVKGKVKLPKADADGTTRRSLISQRFLSSLGSLCYSTSKGPSEQTDGGVNREGGTPVRKASIRASLHALQMMMLARGEKTPAVRRTVPNRSERRSSDDATTWRSSCVSAEDETAVARRKLAQKRTHSRKILSDPLYNGYLGLRSLPVETFLERHPPKWVLPITSINEDRLLLELGLSEAERNQIEGLYIFGGGDASSPHARTNALSARAEQQQSSGAIVRLAANPPKEVGTMQRRTQAWLIRPYPLGLRFSGANMSPLPCWLAGAHSVALNMSNNDLPLQLHFALFDRFGGFLLKPSEMREKMRDLCHPRLSSTQPVRPDANEHVDAAAEGPQFPGVAQALGDNQDGDAYWPPPREMVDFTLIEVFSLCNLPKRGEQRPRRDGSRGLCHKYAPELTGDLVPPDGSDASSPAVQFTLHPIGGFCAISDMLPLPQTVETEYTTTAVPGNGMHAEYYETVYCAATEPYATFLHISVSDGGQEVAYESAVLGRLRNGYRVFQMRSLLGTRIELAYLFVRIRSGTQPNLWVTPRQLRVRSQMLESQMALKMSSMDETIALRVEQELARQTASRESEAEALISITI